MLPRCFEERTAGNSRSTVGLARVGTLRYRSAFFYPPKKKNNQALMSREL
jgi:hypothetical protein